MQDARRAAKSPGQENSLHTAYKCGNVNVINIHEKRMAPCQHMQRGGHHRNAKRQDGSYQLGYLITKTSCPLYVACLGSQRLPH